MLEDQNYPFHTKLQELHLALPPVSIETLQLNITKLCNQACVHCHVDSSPRRREKMSDDILEACLTTLRDNPQIKILDITGGAPELHERFCYLVEEATALNRRVIVRHNLTVTQDLHPISKASMHYLPDFFARHRVEIISSLPYYQEFFTDKQRGSGVFKKSILSLQKLNQLGYGIKGSGLELNLVYNPVGAYLPPPQDNLEKDYKHHLKKHFNIEFNHLFVITNMPIHRFKAQLVTQKNYESYMEKLWSAFNTDAARGIMCRNMISVSYDGRLYDCDFNQMLDLPIDGNVKTIQEFNHADLLKRQIVFRSHCFGCTAGAGSSCGGSTV